MPDLRIPIYSMRSYKTGVYDVSKDGNFQVHLHRMLRDDWIVVPKNSVGIETFIDAGLVQADRILYADYGENAYATRKNFWEMNKNFKIPAGVENLITNMTGCPWDLPIVYYLEITSHPLVPRAYVDEFLVRDVFSINESSVTLVFNDWQKTRLVQAGADPDKIIVSRRVIHPDVLSRLVRNAENEQNLVSKDDIFFPFRISDPCYRFEKVQGFAWMMGKRIVVTDPNESFKTGTGDIIQIHPTKEEYYSILMDKPTILYFEDPDFCFHPGLGELIYFGCNIVSPFKIPPKEDILIL